MASLSSLNGTQSGMALTVAAYQARLQQARSQAAQAQTEVRALENETQQARQRAGQSEQQVRAIQGNPPREQRATINTLGQVTGSQLDVQA
jgi:predicted  nucleic acid-binding Zn-ribbon protein